jgi:hypothetical protein
MSNQEALRLIVSEPEAVEPSPDSCPSRPVARQSGLQLGSQRSLEIDEGANGFVVRAPDGNIELQVRITPDGPVLCFAAAAIEIARTHSLKVDVDRFELCAREQIHLQSYGSLSQTVAGDCTTHCEGRQDVHAGELSVTSHRGPMTLDSTCDLAINGERVLINC